MVKKTMNQMTLLAALRALNPPFPFRTPNKKFEIRLGA